MRRLYTKPTRRCWPTRLLPTVLVGAGLLLAVPGARSQELTAEVQASLLKEQAVTALRSGNTSAFYRAMDDFRNLEKQGAKVPAGLFLAEAETARSRNELLRSNRAFSDYFRVAAPEGDAFSQALNVYAEFKRSIAIDVWPRLEDMVVVPGGTPQSVAAAGGAEEAVTVPEQAAPVAQFALARHEVTRAEFLEFVAATNYVMAPPAEPGEGPCDPARPDWSKSGLEQTNQDPIVCVSWNDATAYLNWLNQLSGLRFRLPTSAEWEHAARAGAATNYWYGDTFDPARDNGPGTSGADTWDRGTAPVGRFPANPFGLHDMVGNVSEWTADCGASPSASTLDAGVDTDAAPRAAACATRIVRGGHWASDEIQPGPTARRSLRPDDRFNFLGFRIAMDF